MINISKKLSNIDLNADINNNSPGTINKHIIKQHQQPKKITENGTTTIKTGREAIAGSVNEKALIELIERSGYPVTQHNGQRRYGPPNSFNGIFSTFLKYISHHNGFAMIQRYSYSS